MMRCVRENLRRGETERGIESELDFKLIMGKEICRQLKLPVQRHRGIKENDTFGSMPILMMITSLLFYFLCVRPCSKHCYNNFLLPEWPYFALICPPSYRWENQST